MAKDHTITGLDIGSSMTRVVVGQGTNQDGVMQIIGAAEHPTDGVSKGSITSIEDAVSAVSQALEMAERMTGIPVSHAYVSINGTHIVSQESHGVIAVAKADGEVKEDDVERVVEAAQAIATPPNYEILHVIPRSFTVDNQRGIKDPVGMTGIRLEVDAEIVQGLSSQVKNLTKVVYRTSVDIDDLVVAVLAAAESCVTKRQRDVGVAVVSIGATTTGVTVFEEGDVIHTKVLPVGGSHVTNDIAIGLRTSIDIAERMKIEHGSALPDEIGKRDEVNLSTLGGEDAVVNKRQVAEIIEARMEEIFHLVDKELQAVDRSGMLPAGIVVTGGGAKLHGVVDVARRIFRLPASIGVPQGLVTAIDRVNDPAFTTAVGLVQWASTGAAGRGGSGFLLGRFSSVGDTVTKMRGWFKSFIS